jgi:hypothetical protein
LGGAGGVDDFGLDEGGGRNCILLLSGTPR